MKNQPKQNITGEQQGRPTSDRAFHNPKDDKKIRGISNLGGQKINSSANKENQRKNEDN